MANTKIPSSRILARNGAPVNGGGGYVLYWMIAYRRTRWNFALQRAAEWARERNKPLLILESLPCSGPWDSDRFHRFVIDGMADNAARFSKTPAAYYPLLDRREEEGLDIAAKLAANATVVVTDDFPTSFIPSAIGEIARKSPVLVEAVDSNGLFPMRKPERIFPTAHSFRRYLQKNLPSEFDRFPSEDPLAEGLPNHPIALPPDLAERLQMDRQAIEKPEKIDLAQYPIDHSVPPAPFPGGEAAARERAAGFVNNLLPDYAENRNHPDDDCVSGLSPYLHFGHISAHDVFNRIADRERWVPERVSVDTRGSKQGWWRMSEPAEGFLDQLVTWREVGFNLCALRDDYDRYESLPDWAIATLGEHAADARPHVYDLEPFERALTHDEIWNAAQNQLRREGRIHNYLRMVWGKKILHWTPNPQAALEIMIHLNNKYALDGCDPNSYSGIFWILGRYDRAWGPERPVFGKIRYMSCRNTARKVRLKEYLKRYAS